MKLLDPSADDERPDRPPGSRDQTVLYVEDDPQNREVAQLRLGRKCHLHLAPDSRSACQILRTHGRDLDVILMDIQLKGSELDGVQLTKLIRGKLPDVEKPVYAQDVPVLARVPLFFVTAYGERYASADLLATGANGVFAKPVDFVKVMGSLARSAVAALTSRD